MKSIKEFKLNKKGSLFDMPMQIMMLFIAITFLIALLPAFSDMIEMSQQSTSMNCPGYSYLGNAGHTLSYNASLSSRTSTIGCMAIRLTVPYLVLGVIVAGVAMIFYGRSISGQQDMQ